MSTFQELQNDIMNHFGANDAEFRDEVKIAINDLIAEINDEVPHAQHKEHSGTFTCTKGTNLVTSAFPTYFDSLLSITLTDSNGDLTSPLVYLKKSEWENRRVIDMPEDLPRWFTIWDGNLYLGAKPDANYTGNIHCYLFDTELVNDADTSNLTDHYERWERIIRLGCYAWMYRYLASDEQAILLSEQKYQQGLRRFRAWTRRRYVLSPDASRVRCYKEITRRTNPLLPREFRRY